jgi:hypothetical protein
MLVKMLQCLLTHEHEQYNDDDDCNIEFMLQHFCTGNEK